jgi:TonB family protein
MRRATRIAKGEVMSQQTNTIFLSTLPDGERRWRSFATSFILEIAILLMLATVTVTAPQLVQHHYTHVELFAPDLTPAPAPYVPKPHIVPPAKAQLERIAPPKPVVLVQPKIEQPVFAAVKPTIVPPQPKPAVVMAAKFDAPVIEKPATPKQMVKTDTFAGSSAAPTVNLPARQVQTGGFGDPNGARTNANATAKTNIAAVGSFDLPQSEGQGNGSGGTRGVKGTVASAGFGNEVANTNAHTSQAKVQLASFGEASVATPTRQQVKVEQPTSTPVAIEAKPQPVYTSEARELRIEGEVLVKVVFSSDGKVKVLNVIRGLGHGLDEAAVRAAQGIQFKPAKRNGQAVDSNATLHIVFQLS